MRVKALVEGLPHRVQVAAAVRVQHALGLAGGSRGVVQRDRGTFVRDRVVQVLTGAGGDEISIGSVDLDLGPGAGEFGVLDLDERLEARNLGAQR